jgi:hypothetical protein
MFMKVLEIFNNEKAGPVFSFIIGLGVVVLFLHKPMTYKYKLESSVSDYTNKPVKFGNKCYVYTAEDSQCDLPSSK